MMTHDQVVSFEIGIQNLSSLTQSGLLVPFTEISQSSLKANSVTQCGTTTNHESKDVESIQIADVIVSIENCSQTPQTLIK